LVIDSNQGQKLDLALGYSQYCFYGCWSNFRNYIWKGKTQLLNYIVWQTTLGQVARKSEFEPEPYKGKGVVGEVRRKAGKSA
jgi:hypothetical protein